MVQGLRAQIALAERTAARWWVDPFFGDMPCGAGSAIEDRFFKRPFLPHGTPNTALDACESVFEGGL